MISMVDLKVQYSEIQDKILKEIKEVFESGSYILGPKVRELEESIAAYYSVKNAVGVASGTDALHLSLNALGIGKCDEVIVSPFTFFATVEAIIYQGAKPVFVDIDPDTLNIASEKIEANITPKTKAIMPVHLFGMPADMEHIREIAKKHNLFIIEDCAQAFGAHIRGKRVGSFGNAGCFSFYPSKNLGAYGDGGIIVTSDEYLSKKVQLLRNHGSGGNYVHKIIGFNSRLDELQAAVLMVKLRMIEKYNTLRRERARFYTERLKDYVKCPEEREGFFHVYQQYTIQSSLRDRIKTLLAEESIPSVIYYPVPLHLQEAVRDLGYKKGSFPLSEKASAEVLSLPIYPEIEERVQEKICGIVVKAVK